MKCKIGSQLFANRKDDIAVLANHYEWCFRTFDQSSGCVIYDKRNAQLNIYITKLTVQVVFTGEKPITRSVDMTDLEMLFIHPRKNFNYKNHFTKQINSLKLQQ